MLNYLLTVLLLLFFACLCVWRVCVCVGGGILCGLCLRNLNNLSDGFYRFSSDNISSFYLFSYLFLVVILSFSFRKVHA